MTPLQTKLDSIRRQAERATKGPWIRLGSSTDTYNRWLWYRDDVRVTDQKICETFGEGDKAQDRENNLRFIAASREVVPFLLEIVRIQGEALNQHIDSAYCELGSHAREAIARCEELAGKEKEI